MYGRFVRVSTVFLSLVLLHAREAFADGKTELEKARLAMIAKRYDVVRERAQLAINESSEDSEPGLRALGYVFVGAAALLSKDESAARAAFEQALAIDARVEPDPLSFPQSVMDLFVDTRASMQTRLSQIAIERSRKEREKRAREDEEKRRFQQRIVLLEAMAGQEVRTVKNTRLVALLPFGVGQFANRQESLGWAILVTQVALGLGTGITYYSFKASRAAAYDEYRRGDPDSVVRGYVDKGDYWKTMNLVFGGAFLVTYAASVTQAQLSFVPEFVETKSRPLPSSITLRPGLGSLSVVGTF